jgi:hypothetical protein
MTTNHIRNLQSTVSALMGYADLLEIKQPRAADLLRAVAYQLDEEVGSLDTTLADIGINAPRVRLNRSREVGR